MLLSVACLLCCILLATSSAQRTYVVNALPDFEAYDILFHAGTNWSQRPEMVISDLKFTNISSFNFSGGSQFDIYVSSLVAFN
jgi:hypothetical protein